VTATLAGNGNSYHTHTLDAALGGIAAAGFRNVELAASRWTEHVTLSGSWHAVRAGQDHLRRRLDRHGLAAVALSTHSDILTPGGLENARRAVRWAAEFGVPVVNTATGGQLRGAADAAAFVAAARERGDAAAAAGVTVGLEIYGEILPSGEQARPLLDQIAHERVGVNYDTANVTFYSGRPAVADLAAIMPHVVSVHLKDIIGGKGSWNFPAIGRGEVDVAAVVSMLRTAGYAGPLSVEIEFSGEPWPELTEVNRAMRESFQYLQHLLS
jgi:L-ribulose-5-phosphate 3-epimerase